MIICQCRIHSGVLLESWCAHEYYYGAAGARILIPSDTFVAAWPALVDRDLKNVADPL